MNKFMPFMLIFFFICGLFVAVSASSLATGLVEDSWNTKAPMNQPRQGVGVVVVNEKIYAIGGVTGGSFVGTTERYDPVTDTWVTLEPMPTPRGWCSIVAYEHKIYCIGGQIRSGILGGNNNDVFSLVNECYDTVTNSWSAKTSVPFSGAGDNAHFVDDQIFIIHGPSGDLFVYNPVIDSWIKKTCIPTPDDFSSSDGAFAVVFSVVIDNKIMVNFWYPTGSEFGNDSEKVIFYDVKTDVWSEGQVTPNVFSPLKGGAVAEATNGSYAPQRVFVFPISTNNNMVYDPITDKWSTDIEAMPAIGSGVNIGVAVLNDVFYIVGGTLNYQYVPIGYGTLSPDTSPSITATPSDSPITPKPEPSKPYLNYIIAATLIVTIGTVTGVVVVYFKKRKQKGDTM